MITDFGKIYHGADYNPEQWKDYPGIIDEDIRLMKLAHCNVMSINIFGWSEIEPAENVYDFAFLDEIMDKLADNGIKAILATPSGSRPAWMSAAHPEVLRTNADRTKNLYGGRHNHCYTSPYYKKKVYEINRRLAERYKNHPALLMWHLSNEYGGECHCPMCQDAFRNWLNEKYHNNLKELNHAYWSKFWSHKYTDWSQIESPSPLGETRIHGLILDWNRFVTHQTMKFIENETAPLKAITPNVPVTTNLMELKQELDYHKLKDVIDIISWDNYPEWHSEDDIFTAQMTAFQHDLFRSLKNKPFFLMESTPSMVNWREYNKPKRPGMNKLSSLQAVAHGSNSVQYFQWRKSRGGCEKMHGAVVDHCGHENTRVFREVAELGEILEKLGDISGTCTDADVAIIFEWENRWALNNMQGLAKPTKQYDKTCYAHYRPFWERGIDVDVISSDDDFSKYKLVIAPMLYMVRTGIDKKIADYVKKGGTFVSTYASGWADENDLCYLGGFPGGELKDVFGIWSEETDVLYPGEKNKVLMGDNEYDAVDYCDVIHTNGANVLAAYKEDYYADMPAFTVNKYGNGYAYYIAFRDCGDFLSKVYDGIIDKLNIKREIENLPKGVTVHTRENEKYKFSFVENYTTAVQTVRLNKRYCDVINETEMYGDIQIKPYQTLILKHMR